MINIKNKNKKCFLWSVNAGLYFKDSDAAHRERVSHYLEYEKEFNLQDISFPMALKDIPKFEKAINVSIFAYWYQEGKEGQERFVYPLKVTKEVNELMLIYFLLLLMIITTIVSSRTLVSWWDRSIRVIIIKHISADSACMGSQELTELKIEVDVEELVKKWK